jgi:hypothetical protein
MVKNDLGKQKKVDSMCDIFVFLLLSVKIHKTNKLNLISRGDRRFFEDNEPHCTVPIDSFEKNNVSELIVILILWIK